MTAFWVLCGALLIAHLWWEGAHWQIYPAYLAIACLLPLSFFAGLSNRVAYVMIGVVLCLGAASCALSMILPVFELPAPTGPYLIGTRIVPMTDASRKEDAGLDRSSPRRFVTQLWYPAQESDHPRAPYRRRSETTFASSYQSVDWTHARYDAPLATIGAPFPIVIYNPGWNGRRTQDTMLVEELASHGYIVAAIDHPYNSGPVDLGNGQVIWPTTTTEFSDETSTKQQIYDVIDREVEKETADTLFVLAQMDRMNLESTNPFHGALDLQKVGALGYSLGGAVAAEAAYQSPKIRAVVDLDTPLYGEAGKHGIAQPFFLLVEDLIPASADEKAHMSYGQRRNSEMDEDDYASQLPMLKKPGDYQFAIAGTLHTSFQDTILFSPLQRFSGAGAVAPRQMVGILRQYTLGFFDQTLRGVKSPLLAQPSSPFNEVKILFRSDAL